MTLKMLLFDYRESEKSYFEKNKKDLKNFDITFYKWSLTPDTVKKLSEEEKCNVIVISVFIDSILDREVINQFKNLRIIATRSTGVDHIDKKACEERNIMLVNVENYGSTTVAQYTLGLIIALTRNIIPANLSIREKKFCDYKFIGRNMGYLTLGVIGTGAIGANLCNYASAFGMKMLAYDLKPKLELVEKQNIKYVEMPELLQKSDIITLHLPYTGNNYHMLGEKEFNMMKDGVYLINTSRGELVDIKALYKYLQNGKIKGVALDVLECEDVSFKCEHLFKKIGDVGTVCFEEARLVRKMQDFPNVIITPHIAYDTQEAIDYILKISITAIKDSLTGSCEYRVL